MLVQKLSNQTYPARPNMSAWGANALASAVKEAGLSPSGRYINSHVVKFLVQWPSGPMVWPVLLKLRGRQLGDSPHVDNSLDHAKTGYFERRYFLALRNRSPCFRGPR